MAKQIDNKFEEFKALSAEFDEKIRGIEVSLQNAERDLIQFRQQYEEGISNFLSDKLLSKIEDQMDQTRKRIHRLSDQLDYAGRAKRQRLAELIPIVTGYRDELKAQKIEEFKVAEADLHEVKYQFLNALSRVGGIVREIDSLHEETNSLRGEAGETKEHYFGFRSNDYLLFNVSPSTKGIDSAIREALSVPEWLAKEVYHGRLPQWVRERRDM